MSNAKVVVGATLSSLGFAVLLAWVTWNFVFTRVDRVFWLLLLGYGSVGGQ